MTTTATNTAEYRASKKAVDTAQEIIEWAEHAGISFSPSTVRYEMAKALMRTLSQSSIRRLHEEVRRLNDGGRPVNAAGETSHAVHVAEITQPASNAPFNARCACGWRGTRHATRAAAQAEGDAHAGTRRTRPQTRPVQVSL